MSTPRFQTPVPRDRSAFLRAALRGNAFFSAASGVALVAAAPALAVLLGPVKPAVLRLIGAMLLLYAGGLLMNAHRPAVRRAEAIAAITLDAGWVVGSGILLVTEVLAPPGAWMVSTVAVIVAGLAFLQWVGLRRSARAGAPGTPSAAGGPLIAGVVLLASLSVAAPAVLVAGRTPSPAPPGDAAAPTAEEVRHRDFLGWEEGQWTAEVTLPDPSGNGQRTYRGVQTDRLGACGLWLITDLSMVAGTGGETPPPYEGHGVLGFDPAKGKLVGIWVDSKTHWLGTAEGSVDPTGRTMTLEVESRIPDNGAVYHQRFRTTRVDQNTRSLEVTVPTAEGKRITVAEIRYARK